MEKIGGGINGTSPPPVFRGGGGGADYQKIATKNKRTTKQKLATPPTSVPRLAWVVDHMVHRGDSIALAPLQIEYPPPPPPPDPGQGVCGCATVGVWYTQNTHTSLVLARDDCLPTPSE